VVVISTLTDTDVVWAVGNRLALQANIDGVVTSILGSKVNSVGTIAVIEDFSRDITSGTFDLDVERITTSGSLIILGVSGFNGEVSGKVVLNTIFKGGSINLGLRGISTSTNVDVERRVLDVVEVDRSSGVLESNNDVVVAGFSGLVLDRVGTIVVVGDFSRELSSVGLSNVDNEGVLFEGDGLVVRVAGIDGEVGRFSSVSALETRSLGEAFHGIGVSSGSRDVDVVWAASNGGIVEGYLYYVVASIDGVVRDGVSTVVVVADGSGNITVEGARNSDLVGITSGFDFLAKSVNGLNGEVGRLALNNRAVNTRAVDLGLRRISGSTINGNGPRRVLDGRTLQVDRNSVLARGGCNVLNGVGTVAIVFDGRLEVAGGTSDGDIEVLTTNRNVDTSLVDSLNGEVGGDASLSMLETGTVGGTVGGESLSGSEFLSSTSALIVFVITEIRDVGHG
jgi:hypothetical protein